LANPKEVSQVTDLMVPASRPGVVAGEQDTCIINDVMLQIPPQRIRVSKQSLNYEWHTLRTTFAQKAKSGHGKVLITLDLIFEGNAAINGQMRPLIAGLRATPFCVCYNKYLQDSLMGMENAKYLSESKTQYKHLRPLALAVTGMHVQTIEGHPESVRVVLEFIWFNYSPYMPVWAYKVGELHDRPGTANKSSLWKKFYEPFMYSRHKIDWPHQPGSRNSKTSIFFREFATFPRVNASGYRAVRQLLELLKNNPTVVIQTLNKVLADEEIEWTDQNIFDVVYRELANNKNVNEEIRKRMKQSSLRNGMITRAAEGKAKDALSAIARDTYNDSVTGQHSWSQMREKEVEDAIRELTKRQEDAAQQEKMLQYLGVSSENSSEYKKLDTFSLSGEVPHRGSQLFIGGFDVYGRKNKLDIVPETGFIIESIAVTFSNALAVIPMMAYRYPTAQHIGSNDVEVSMVLNCTNDAARRLQALYDVIEATSLKYKMIPQGFLNPWIYNDLINFFGLKEFLTKNLVIETYPGQPGRSRAILTLSHAGVLSSSGLRDPEALVQEYISTSSTVQGRMNKVFSSLIREKGQTDSLLTPASLKYYFIEPKINKFNPRYAAIGNLLQDYCDEYNGFLKRVHGVMWEMPEEGTGAGSYAPVEAEAEGLDQANYNALMDLVEFSSEHGFIANINRIQNSVTDRDSAMNAEAQSRARTRRAQSVDQITKQRRRYRSLKRVFGIDDKGRKDWIELNKQAYNVADPNFDFLKKVYLNKYQEGIQRAFDTIMKQYPDHPDFASVFQVIEDSPLRKGTMTYMDFRPQIKSVYGYVNPSEGITPSKNRRGGTVKEEELIQFNPDLYLYYPVFDGGIVNLSEGKIIDSDVINKARKLSLKTFDEAQQSTNDWFKGNYLSSLRNASISQPYDNLEKRLKNGELQAPFYEGESWKNSTRTTDIQKTVVVDDLKQGHINYPRPGIMRGQNEISVANTMSALWQGADAGAKPYKPSDRQRSSPPVSGTTKERAKRIFPYVKQAAQKWDLDPGLIYAVIEKESGVGRNMGPNQVTATGYMQLLQYEINPRTRKRDVPSEAQQFATQRGQTLLDPGTNIDRGCFLLNRYSKRASKKGLRRGSNEHTELLLAYYNMGPGIVDQWQSAKKKTARGQSLSSKEERRIGEPPETGGQSGGFGSVASPTGLIPLRTYKRYTNKIMSNVPKWRKFVAEQNAKSGTPSASQQARIDRGREQALNTDVTSSTLSPITEAIKSFEEDLYHGQAQSLIRAYPAFKLYFIEDDSQEKRLAFDDFFSYNAVQSIRVVRSRNIPADMCEIVLTNISGTLTNRKFRQGRDGGSAPRDSSGRIVQESINPSLSGTSMENPIASLLLREGTHISLRLGYSNDPDRLELVFTGVITEIEFLGSEDLIRILAQSYAIELVQDIKGFEKPKKVGSWEILGWGPAGLQDASTSKVLEEMITQPEVVHFGRWKALAQNATPLRELLTNKYHYVPTPQDDNIFAPPPEMESEVLLNEGWFIDSTSYVIYRTTIWDIFQEMTLRHPNFVALPVPYKGRDTERMTMFYGLPNQLYFARDADYKEESASNVLRDRISYLERKQKEAKAVSSGLYRMEGSNWGPGKRKATDDEEARELAAKFTAESIGRTIDRIKNQRLRLAKRSGYIKPFRNYHLLTSDYHIISNNIQANARDVANTIVVQYGADADPSEITSSIGGGEVAVAGADENVTVKLDSALPTEEIRTQIAHFLNVTTEDMAKRYGLGMLLRNVRDIYKGEIALIGNPKIKPCDICYLFDQYNDMIGPVEVEQVTHVFDFQHGFRTEVKPDMFAQVGEWALLSTADAMGVVMEGALKHVFGSSVLGSGAGRAVLSGLKYGSRAAAFFGPAGLIAAGAVHYIGGFMSQAIVNFTQMGYPLVLSPLQHRGRVFAGGVPTSKLPKSMWNRMFGEWTPMAEQGFAMWAEDKVDEVMVGLKKLGGLWGGGYSEGDFWNDGNTLKVK